MRLLYLGANREDEDFAEDTFGDSFDVHYVSDPADAKTKLKRFEYDAMIMDTVNTDFLKEVEDSEVPSLFLSKKLNDEMKIWLLQKGVTSILEKNINLKIIKIQIEKLIFLYRQYTDFEQISVGDITIDINTRVVKRCKIPILLKKIEYDILELLSLNKGKVVTFEKILDYIWGMEDCKLNNVLHVHVHRLRNKLGMGKNFIRTVKGFGYLLSD